MSVDIKERFPGMFAVIIIFLVGGGGEEIFSHFNYTEIYPSVLPIDVFGNVLRFNSPIPRIIL